ncbi:MAG: hypothetical protein VW933_07890, partial [Flavobacteriaceae bacterium]
PLPAYVISYDHPEDIKAFIAVNSGAFMKIRHRNWRWFDFLWMSHTMDYQGRDDFNNLLLRVFSLFGVLTVMSGFLLWGYSSPRQTLVFTGAFALTSLFTGMSKAITFGFGHGQRCIP